MIAALLIPGLLFLALALVAWIGDREPAPERIDRRLTEDELRYTGEDWRVHVADYFRKRQNTDRIIREVTGTWKS